MMKSYKCSRGRHLNCQGVVTFKVGSNNRTWDICRCDCHSERFNRTGEYCFVKEHKKLKNLLQKILEKKSNDLEFRNIIGNRIMKKKELFEFCNSCGEYKQHIRTASNIIRCKICGHGNWTAWNEEFESKNKRLSRNKCLIL
uniref:Uncharacterized protein n=1 Tax=viral metagenome TaxID=1070528 RepID=A0A6H1ZTQ2_9ZZZZ